MKLGYSITSFQNNVTPTEAVENVFDRGRVAREAGFDYVQTGDHHGVGNGSMYLQSVPMAARFTELFDHVAAMILLPLYHPVLLAEQIGTITGFVDEFDFWCGVGGSNQPFAAFGVPLEERASRFEEAVSLMKRLWREDRVSFDGEFFSVDDLSVSPKCDPRVCIGGIAEPAVRRAGRLGDAWVAMPNESLADLNKKHEWFEQAGGGSMLVRREALVLPDGKMARELVQEKLKRAYRGWSADADWVLCGNPMDVVTELQNLRDLGATEVIIRPMSQTHAAETLRGVARARDELE